MAFSLKVIILHAIVDVFLTKYKDSSHKSNRVRFYFLLLGYSAAKHSQNKKIRYKASLFSPAGVQWWPAVLLLSGPKNSFLYLYCMKIIAMIPARYAATRFPAKLMQLLGEKPVIRHTYDNTLATGLFD